MSQGAEGLEPRRSFPACFFQAEHPIQWQHHGAPLLVGRQPQGLHHLLADVVGIEILLSVNEVDLEPEGIDGVLPYQPRP